MRISLQWLREWVNTGDDVPALSHALTMAGLEIEGVERAGPPLEGIVVGEVLSVEQHPDAEKLRVCRVASGRGELQIVCGAPNVRSGMKAPLALVGAIMPNGMEIKPAKLRGVESAGMLCSAKELGINDDTSGLFDLPADFVTGRALAQALSLDDLILEVNLTPNRGDCMSVAGVAREVAAINDTALTPPVIAPVAATISDSFPVRISAGTACPKFVSRVVRGVSAAAKSPFWIQERLRRAGVRPISAVVDVTNFVVLELGQPMHAYDLGKLDSGIDVRLAAADEKLTLLDAREITLTSDVLVVADHSKALAFAGVMGGLDSSITDTTTDVLLEVAFFTPDAVASRGRRYGLVTDSSQRFERGVDPQLQERAIERATQLLLECAGGQPGPVTRTTANEATVTELPIRLRHARIEKVLGVAIDASVIEQLLGRLGMQVQRSSDNGEWRVAPPSWRFDIHIEEDLIEEIARLFGFDNIPEQTASVQQDIAPWTEQRLRNERAADVLVDRGYHEAITYSFTDASSQAVLFPATALALKNPISAELGVMRLSLWPGLLQAVRENQRRQQQRVRLFEIGRRFAAVTGDEQEVIAGVASGTAASEQWGEEGREIDFFDVKADVEALLALTGQQSGQIRFVSAAHSALHPGQSAQIFRGPDAIGWIGSVHPQAQRALDLTYRTIVFEIDTTAGFLSVVPEYREISRYPAIRRDIALIVDEAVAVQALRDVVTGSGGELLRDVAVLSVYRGKQFDKGKKSIALGLHLQDTSRTLTDQEADAIVARVVDQLARQLNATIRDK